LRFADGATVLHALDNSTIQRAHGVRDVAWTVSIFGDHFVRRTPGFWVKTSSEKLFGMRA
jgi:hypothetical protein